MTLSRMEGENLILEYDLFDLPTAQHKAGLAGLLILARSMKERGIWKGTDPEVKATSIRVSLTSEALQVIFNDLYSAQWVEKEYKTKWKGKEPKRTETRQVSTGKKTKDEKWFVYDAVQPLGAFLTNFYTDGDGLWVKLWRDMLWNTLRSKPASRRVYEEMATKGASSLGSEWWKILCASARDRKKGKLRTISFGSSIFIGAQDENAERIPFKGVAEETLLLHFWPVATCVFSPKTLDIKRDRERGLVAKSKDAGYVVVVPDPANLKYFIDDAIQAMRSLEINAAVYPRYRPAASLIDVPAEGGMEYLYYLAQAKATAGNIADSLAAVELYHLEKRGNNVPLLAAERISPKPDTLKRYESLRKQWANPLFKAVGLANLLADVPWYRGFDTLFATHPWQLFVQSAETPKEIRFFGRDVSRGMKALEENQKILRRGGVMAGEERADQLAVRVYQLVANYVNRKTEEKSGKEYKVFKNNKDEKGRVAYPREYRDALEKVCTDAFLGIRGRSDKEFVEYFTGTLCSVPQFLPEAEFVAVAQALASDWEAVKTLSMLALSAASYLSGSADDPKEATQ